jgi:hypothetical protein
MTNLKVIPNEIGGKKAILLMKYEKTSDSLALLAHVLPDALSLHLRVALVT